MSKEIKTKINRLINQWPRGTVAASSHLNASGFSYDLLTRYKQSGWLESFGRGGRTKVITVSVPLLETRQILEKDPMLEPVRNIKLKTQSTLEL